MIQKIKVLDSLKIIILFSVVARVLFILVFINLNEVNYYEYGIISQNLHDGKGYSISHIINGNINNPITSSRVYTSAYMPPGYVYFLYPFCFISSTLIRNILIISSQIIISCLLILLIYSFAKQFFSEWSALIAAAITALLPELIYSSTQIQVTLFYQIGIITLLSLLYKSESSRSRISTSILIGIAFGIVILFRFEIILFALIIAAYFAKKKRIKDSLIIIGIILLFVFPWQIRNYLVFDNLIPFTTSSGLNLYRGHNPYSVGYWGDNILFAKLEAAAAYDDYELRMNNIYFQSALSSVKENPGKEIIYPFVKLFDLWIFNPSDERTNNFFYQFPWFILLLFFIYGFIKSISWKDHKFAYLFLIFFNIVTIIFFALPRYQTMMKIALIPFAAYGIEVFLHKIRARKFSSQQSSSKKVLD